MYRHLMTLLIVSAVLATTACSRQNNANETLYQTSTIHALIAGVYDGEVACGSLSQRGDLGIGTFDALDGEMVFLDGECYKVRSDGKAVRVPDSEHTPFAAVTFFDADTRISGTQVTSFDDLTLRWLDGVCAGNIPVAIRMEGEFAYVKTRAVPRQSKPYPALTEVVKHQPTFEFQNVRGTIVGFYLPEFFAGVNVPGYHLHFLTEDRTAGGHLLDLRAEAFEAALDETPNLWLELPTSDAFMAQNLDAGDAEAVHAVERD